jgi:hypothetical protein
LQRLANADRAAVEVHCLPGEPECLPLRQPQASATDQRRRCAALSLLQHATSV